MTGPTAWLLVQPDCTFEILYSAYSPHTPQSTRVSADKAELAHDDPPAPPAQRPGSEAVQIYYIEPPTAS